MVFNQRYFIAASLAALSFASAPLAAARAADRNLRILFLGDTLAWFRSLPQDRQQELRAATGTAKEASVLAAGHESLRTGG